MRREHCQYFECNLNTQHFLLLGVSSPVTPADTSLPHGASRGCRCGCTVHWRALINSHSSSSRRHDEGYLFLWAAVTDSRRKVKCFLNTGAFKPSSNNRDENDEPERSESLFRKGHKPKESGTINCIYSFFQSKLIKLVRSVDPLIEGNLYKLCSIKKRFFLFRFVSSATTSNRFREILF